MAHGQAFANVANGPDAPAVGTIVPDDVTFLVADAASDVLAEQARQANLSGQNYLFPDLRRVSYSDFENEVVVTLYHTPW